MHARLFANQRALARPDLSEHVKALGLNVAAFDQCLDTGKSAARVRKDVGEAQAIRVTGTPTFFLGPTEPSSSKIKGVRMSGAQPYQAFKAAIERLLADQK